MKTLKQYSFIGIMAILLMATAFYISGCRKAQKEEDKQKQTEREEITKSEIKEKVSEEVYPLPSTFEITETLNEIGASFIIALTNDVENADKYVTEEKQALNLGVYSADLSYATTYNMKQYIMDYMDANRTLVDELGISGAYSPEFVKKIKENFNNKEQLVDMLTNSFYETYKYMNKQGNEELALLIVAGSWVEAIYITTHISENTYHNQKIVDLIREQESSLNKLLNILKPQSSNNSIQNVIKDLQPIKEVYDNRGNQGFTEEQVMKLQELSGKIRNEIIS
ncbi:MAG: hypothetical protein V5A59_03110 [Bacteroidales bacterium]|nr:hypothetical protein [Bacteroidales bacterium]